METFVSKTSGITYPISERIAGLLISPSILNLIRKEFPDFKETDFMSMQELAIFREKYMVFILIWIIINIVFLANKSFDPYPFILLNLILSCIASLQAPVIMMSQNRQEEKDRERAKKDYMINLKSELEIRILHEKIDHLMLHQQQDLIEIQKVQIDMMNDILKNLKK